MKKRMFSLALCITLIFSMTLLSGCQKTAVVNSSSDSSDSDSSTISSDASTTQTISLVEDVSTEASLEEVEESEKPVELDNFIMYFSGIDVWGWTDITSRSDVNIIAAVNTKTRHILLVNTPRDYYVEMPNTNGAKDKLTHAGIYGPENSMGALENLYGIDIDYFLRLNFSGFEATIDAMGGLDVYSEYDFTVEPIKHYTEGYNHLTGLETLAFVRERHAFASGDRQRGRNQMAVIKAMVKKICSLDFLLNHEEILTNLTDMYRTSMPDELVLNLIFNQLQDDSEWTVDTMSVSGSDGSEATYTAPGSKHYVMIPNLDDVAKAKETMMSVLAEEEITIVE